MAFMRLTYSDDQLSPDRQQSLATQVADPECRQNQKLNFFRIHLTFRSKRFCLSFRPINHQLNDYE